MLSRPSTEPGNPLIRPEVAGCVLQTEARSSPSKPVFWRLKRHGKDRGGGGGGGGEDDSDGVSRAERGSDDMTENLHFLLDNSCTKVTSLVEQRMSLRFSATDSMT